MFSRNSVIGVWAAVGMVLGAYYLMVMLQRVVFGPLHEPHADHENFALGHTSVDHGNAAVRPMGWHEIAGLAPLMALIVLIGVYPRPIFDRIAPAARTIAAGFPQAPTASSRSPSISAEAPPRNATDGSQPLSINGQTRAGPRPMSTLHALNVAQQTLLALLPEIVIITAATCMMTAGAFVKLPRRVWSIAAAVTLLAALGGRWAVRDAFLTRLCRGRGQRSDVRLLSIRLSDHGPHPTRLVPRSGRRRHAQTSSSATC